MIPIPDYWNLLLFDVTALATIVGFYTLARLAEMPLKGVANQRVRTVATAVLAGLAGLFVLGNLVWVWYNFWRW
jgi:hypothetical protein